MTIKQATTDTEIEAVHLYEAPGFRRTAPYYENPLHGVVYWELNLVSREGPADSGPLSHYSA